MAKKYTKQKQIHASSTHRSKRGGQTSAHKNNGTHKYNNRKEENTGKNAVNNGNGAKKRKASYVGAEMERGQKKQRIRSKKSQIISILNASNESNSFSEKKVTHKLNSGLTSKRSHSLKEKRKDIVAGTKVSSNFETTKKVDVVYQPQGSIEQQQHGHSAALKSTASLPQICTDKGSQCEKDVVIQLPMNTDNQTIAIKTLAPSPLRIPKRSISERSERSQNITTTSSGTNTTQFPPKREQNKKSEIVASLKNEMSGESMIESVSLQSGDLSENIKRVNSPSKSTTGFLIKSVPTHVELHQSEVKIEENLNMPSPVVEQKTGIRPIVAQEIISEMQKQPNSSLQNSANRMVKPVYVKDTRSTVKNQNQTAEDQSIQAEEIQNEKTKIENVQNEDSDAPTRNAPTVENSSQVTFSGTHIFGTSEDNSPLRQPENLSKMQEEFKSPSQAPANDRLKVIQLKNIQSTSKIQGRTGEPGNEASEEQKNIVIKHIKKSEEESSIVEKCREMLPSSIEQEHNQKQIVLSSDESSLPLETRCEGSSLSKAVLSQQFDNGPSLKNTYAQIKVLKTEPGVNLLDSNQQFDKTSTEVDYNTTLPRIQEKNENVDMPEKDNPSVGTDVMSSSASAKQMFSNSKDIVSSLQREGISKVQNLCNSSPQAPENHRYKSINNEVSQLSSVNVEDQAGKTKNYHKEKTAEDYSKAEKHKKRQHAEVCTSKNLKRKSQVFNTFEKHEDTSTVIGIPQEMRSSELMSCQSYILHSVSHYTCITNKFCLEDFLLDKKSKEHSSLGLITVLLNIILDSMGFLCTDKCNDETSSSRMVRLMSKERKPKQTAASVRDFIMDLFEQNIIEDNGVCVIEQICLAFRLACHFAHSVCEKTSRPGESRKSEQLKRGLLTLLSCLRGLYAQLLERSMDEVENAAKNKANNRIQRFFNGHEKFSSAELLLLDVIPLLTDMDHKHGALGSKKSIAILKHLVKLEKSFKSVVHHEVRKLSVSSLSGMFCNDGLMEMFMRQLLNRENILGEDAALKRELEHCQSKFSSTGILACTLTSMTSSCQQTIAQVVALRQNTINILTEPLSTKSQDDKKCVKVTPGTASTVSDHIEGFDGEDSIWYDAHPPIAKKYNELRLDGCIYLSKILHYLRTGGQAKSNPQKEKSADTFLELCRTVFFLLHSLFDNDPFPEPSHEKSLQRRDNLKSAVLSCLLLAGKIIDRPVKLRRLLDLANKVPFPNLNILDKFITSKAIIDINSGGEPKKALIKEYEFHLLMSFGCIAPSYEDIFRDEVLTEIEQELYMDRRASVYYRNSFYHVAFTHSPLCLLEDQKLVALGVYHLTCEMTGIPPCADYMRKIFFEERRVAECLSTFMSQTVSYVHERVKQIQQLYRFTGGLASPSEIRPIDVDLPDFQSLLEDIKCMGY